MKILIVGAGAVGGYFGGLLAKDGNDVTFIARGNHLKKINEDGLTVKSIHGDFCVEVKASDKIGGDEIFDLIFFSVKGYDLEQASELIKNSVTDNTVIISLLNGVESEEFLQNKFGINKVVGGIAFIGASIESPGVIHHSAAGFITIGEIENSSIDRCKKIKDLFDNVSVKCDVVKDIKKSIWTKMVWNVGFNSTTAITGGYVIDVIENKFTKNIIRDAMNETIQVAKSKGVLLEESLVESTILRTTKLGKIKTSMLQDIEHSKKTEIDMINGAIVRIGEQTGVPTPVNKTLHGLIKYLEPMFQNL